MATLRVRPRRAGVGARLASWVGPLRTSSPAKAALLIGSLVFGLVIVGTIALILELRSREIRDARRGLGNINTVLAEATSRALQSVDLVLLAIAGDLRTSGSATPAGLERLRDDRAAHDMLRARVEALPQLNAISLVDMRGNLVAFSREFPAPVINLSDREHFRQLTGAAVAEPFMSEPVENRATGKWTVYLSRRIVDASGAVIGLVYGAVELKYFLDLYGSLDISRDSSVALWRQDGTLLARRPMVAGGIGRRFSTLAVDSLTPASPPLVYETDESIDGQPRMVARRVVPNFPVAIVTTLNMRDVLGVWRRQSGVLALFGVLLAGAVAVATVALGRQFSAFEQVARATRETVTAVQGLHEVEAQLRQSQKLEAMGQMTSGVAHDFNNLLTIVLGNLDRLGRLLEAGPEEPRRSLEGARAGADRAAALTHRLLAFSRRQPLEAKSVDVNATVQGMADILRQTLGSNMAIAFDLAPDLATVRADPNSLESALLNLVVNARDAMTAGGTVTIETRALETDTPARHIALTVADTGTGMAPDVMRRALEPFFTTKRPGVGTGLGLPQVYGFVRETGGDIAIDSTEGIGTRVRLTLPCETTDGAGLGTGADSTTTGVTTGVS